MQSSEIIALDVAEMLRRWTKVIPILRVSHADQSVQWYRRLGFEPEWEHRFEPHLPVFVSIARGSMRLFLSEHSGDVRPNTLVYLRIENVDKFALEFGVPVQDQPWAREIELQDPDHNRLRLGTSK